MTKQIGVRKLAIGLMTALLIVVPAVTSLAVEVRLSSFTGRVEVRPNGGDWQAAQEGMMLSMGSSISTGFNASAVLDIGQNTLEVNALSRLTIEELAEREGVVDTNLHLPVGRVRGEVRRTDEGRQSEFSIRGAVATAAVRGTSFEFDGVNLRVAEGNVSVANRFGHQVSVGGGQSSSTADENEAPSTPDESLEAESSVQVYTGGTEDGIRTRRSSATGMRVILEFDTKEPVFIGE